jgi:hypothetical protein
MIKHERIGKKLQAFSIWRITGETELEKLSRLVISLNYKHYLNQQSYPHDEFEKIYQGDTKALFDSVFMPFMITKFHFCFGKMPKMK